MAISEENAVRPSKTKVVFGKRVRFHTKTSQAGWRTKYALSPGSKSRHGNSERRKQIRKRSFKSGRMVFNDGNSTIDCVIHDVAAGGARLNTASTLNVPKTFNLLKLASGRIQSCQLVWRGMGRVGVRYI